MAMSHLLSVHGSKIAVFHGNKLFQNHRLFMYKIDKSEKTQVFYHCFETCQFFGKKSFNHAGDMIFDRYDHIKIGRSK